MGKKQREEAGEAARPIQDGAGMLPLRKSGSERQRETAARLEKFAHTPGKAAGSRSGKAGGPVESGHPLDAARPEEDVSQSCDSAVGAPLSPISAQTLGPRPCDEEQPTLKEVLAAIHKCNASLVTLSSQVGSIQEGLSILRHDVQKIRERTAALEGRVGEAEDNVHHLQNDLGATSRKAEMAYSKTEDLENRLRRNNLRLVGIPEKVEGASATDFVEKWLADKFGEAALSPLFAVERAHRVPMRPLPPGNPPSALPLPHVPPTPRHFSSPCMHWSTSAL